MSLFETLWYNHPTITDDDYPCTSGGSANFDNQCAIRLGVCLDRSGLKVQTLPVEFCWHHDRSEAHVLRAEALAKGLEKRPLSPRVRRPIKFSGSDGFQKLAGKHGIIFFRDYYGRNGQGDHIDLWSDGRLTRLSSYWQFLVRSGGRYRKADVWFFRVIG